MTESKHTPGPWKVTPSFRMYHVPACIEDSSGNPVALADSGGAAFDDIAIAANARLIAAAPELLEALEETCRALHRACDMIREALPDEGFPDYTEVINDAYKLIAKAKGES